jgi:hypothetical protein
MAKTATKAHATVLAVEEREAAEEAVATAHAKVHSDHHY